MNYCLDVNHNLTEVQSPQDYNLVEVDYILHYGRNLDYFKNNKFAKVWEHKKSQKKGWSLYKVIRA